MLEGEGEKEKQGGGERGDIWAFEREIWREGEVERKWEKDMEIKRELWNGKSTSQHDTEYSFKKMLFASHILVELHYIVIP